MANAQVEKLKALGLRHGEKAVVTLAGVLCLLFLFLAVTKKTIELTPDQVSTAAKQAESRLSARQEPDDILKQLEEQGIKNPGFEKMVDAQEKEALNPAAYKVAHQWVIPEPGAGLIRDTPELIAPSELFAYPGRGGALVFVLDEEGKRVLDNEPKVDKTAQERRSRKGRKKRRRGGMMGMMSGSSGMMSGMPGMPGAEPPPDSEEAKKEYERKQKELARKLAGKVGPEEEKDKEKAAEGGPEGPFKEVTKGLRWVAITGVLDHKKMKDNWVAALKYTTAAPNYKQLDVQRQVLQSDGTWSEWEDVSLDENRKITDNLPEEEEELTPDEVRISTLVDPLPFLKNGYWERVHVASLVPKEKREIAKPEPGMMMPGMMAGSSGMMDSSMMAGSPGMMAGNMMGSGMMSSPGDMMGSSMMMGSGMMGGMAAPGVEENTNFEKSEKDQLMVRSLDFTVDPDTTYKFRVRVVVFNPNYKREDISPGVDNKKETLEGPWSEPTNEVTMPADVATYAMSRTPAGAKRNDQVHFQVVRWSPEDGVTVTRFFDAGPGEVVGDPATTEIPYAEGEKSKRRLIDYNSHQIVVDAEGGAQPIAQVGASGSQMDFPAVTLLMRKDGTLVVRRQSADATDPVRKDMDETYKRELKESGKKRESSLGSYGGMMMGSSAAPGAGM